MVWNGSISAGETSRPRRRERAWLTALRQKTQKDLQANWRDAQGRFDRAFGKEQSGEIRRALALISSPEFAATFRRNVE